MKLSERQTAIIVGRFRVFYTNHMISTCRDLGDLHNGRFYLVETKGPEGELAKNVLMDFLDKSIQRIKEHDQVKYSWLLRYSRKYMICDGFFSRDLEYVPEEGAFIIKLSVSYYQRQPQYAIDLLSCLIVERMIIAKIFAMKGPSIFLDDVYRSRISKLVTQAVRTYAAKLDAEIRDAYSNHAIFYSSNAAMFYGYDNVWNPKRQYPLTAREKIKRVWRSRKTLVNKPED